MVFCKPDALIGERGATGAIRAKSFLSALAAMAVRLAGAAPAQTPESDWIDRVERADRQVAERAQTEPLFRGHLVDAAGCARRLFAAAKEWPDEPTPTTHVLRASVARLGFEVTLSMAIRFTEADVDGVYATTTSTASFDDVRSALGEYLVNHPVLVWRLGGEQQPAVLQWWKTYARHLLMDRAPGTYALRNLVHVCDGPDEAYLSGLVAERIHR